MGHDSLRAIALDYAVKTSFSLENADDIVKRADKFFEFLNN